MTVILYSLWEVLCNGYKVSVCYSVLPNILWILVPCYCKTIVLCTHSDPNPDGVEL